MARIGLNRLSATKIERIKEPGFYADGGCLYLDVSRNEDTSTLRRSWIFRYKPPGKPERDMGLGPLDTVGLAHARELAQEARALRAKGVDPIDHRDVERGKALAAMPVPTFDQMAAGYIAAKGPGWSRKSHEQWGSSLRLYVSPAIGKLPVALLFSARIFLDAIQKTERRAGNRACVPEHSRYV